MAILELMEIYDEVSNKLYTIKSNKEFGKERDFYIRINKERTENSHYTIYIEVVNNTERPIPSIEVFIDGFKVDSFGFLMSNEIHRFKLTTAIVFLSGGVSTVTKEYLDKNKFDSLDVKIKAGTKVYRYLLNLNEYLRMIVNQL